MNTALLQDGYMLAAIETPYCSQYIQALETAHENDRPFVQFIAERILDTQSEIMKLLHIEV